MRSTLDEFGVTQIVLDPVMVATSGDRLIDEDAVQVLATELAPYARVVTPNIPEAEFLAGVRIASQEDLPQVARALPSALASFLAQGFSLDDAARNAKEYISAAIEAGTGYEIGHGHGPVKHFI